MAEKQEVTCYIIRDKNSKQFPYLFSLNEPDRGGTSFAYESIDAGIQDFHHAADLVRGVVNLDFSFKVVK